MDTTNVKDSAYICEITESKVFIEEVGYTTVYGINMYNRSKEVALLDDEHCLIEDISDDFEKVSRLCRLLIELDVSPLHLKEIAEDFQDLNI